MGGLGRLDLARRRLFAHGHHPRPLRQHAGDQSHSDLAGDQPRRHLDHAGDPDPQRRAVRCQRLGDRQRAGDHRQAAGHQLRRPVPPSEWHLCRLAEGSSGDDRRTRHRHRNGHLRRRPARRRDVQGDDHRHRQRRQHHHGEPDGDRRDDPATPHPGDLDVHRLPLPQAELRHGLHLPGFPSPDRGGARHVRRQRQWHQ